MTVKLQKFQKIHYSIIEKSLQMCIIKKYIKNNIYLQKRERKLLMISSVLWNYQAHLYSPSSKKIKKSTPKEFLIFQEIELSSSKIKKFLLFYKIELFRSKTKKFLIYFHRWNCLASYFFYIFYFFFQEVPSWAPKNKKIHPPKKNSLYVRKIELSDTKIKKFLKNFLYFGKWKTRKKFLYFRKWKFLVFQETETLKNFLYFRKLLSALKNKKNSLLKKVSYLSRNGLF